MTGRTTDVSKTGDLTLEAALSQADADAARINSVNEAFDDFGQELERAFDAVSPEGAD